MAEVSSVRASAVSPAWKASAPRCASSSACRWRSRALAAPARYWPGARADGREQHARHADRAVVVTGEAVEPGHEQRLDRLVDREVGVDASLVGEGVHQEPRRLWSSQDLP
jgi:hypothetical protein